MGSDKESEAKRAERLLQLARSKANVNAAPPPQHKDFPRGTFLMVQNSLSQVPESDYKPSKTLPELERGYCLRAKGSKPNEGFVIAGQLSPGSYAAVKGLKGQTARPTHYLRLELTNSTKSPRQLKREVAILQDAATKAHPENQKHFLKIEARGRIIDQSFNYVIVPLCDKTLVLLARQFTPADALRLSIQCFQAVHDLHALGYVHRNLKPSIFGLRPADNGEMRVYLLSFEHSYRFRKRDGKESRSPKTLFRMKKAKFLPRSYHLVKEITRRDDLESWLYVCVHLMEPACLNWQNSMQDMNMLSMKERFFCIDFDAGPFVNLPKDIHDIVKYIQKLSADARPDYLVIGRHLAEICRKYKFPVAGIFDFQKHHYAAPKAWSEIALGKKTSVASRKSSIPESLEPWREEDFDENGVHRPRATTTEPKKRKTRRQTAATPPPPPDEENPFDINAVLEAGNAAGEKKEEVPPPPATMNPSGQPTTKSKQRKTKRKRTTLRTPSIQQPPDNPQSVEVPILGERNYPPAPIATKPAPSTAEPAKAATPPVAETQDPDEDEDAEAKPTQQTAVPPHEDNEKSATKDSSCSQPPAVFSANTVPQPKIEDPKEEL